jgi:hypothetical protein
MRTKLLLQFSVIFETMAIDTTALDGLRWPGMSAYNGNRNNISFSNLEICLQLFHYLGHMTYGAVDLNGSLELSLFFLISGFSLTFGYGKYEAHLIIILLSNLKCSEKTNNGI